MAGYSGTPLAGKLGIKPGFRVKVRNAPSHYDELVAPVPEDVRISARLRSPVDMYHLFVTTRVELTRCVQDALQEIHPNGMIWVSWPKKASGVPTDLTEDVVRDVALPLSLVDVKVCAVDDTWSGLKLVIRREARLPRMSR